MLPKTHFIINLILSLILILFFPPFYVLVFLAASVLIDVDHYLYYIYEEKDFSLKKAYHWHKLKRKEFHDLSREEKKKHRYLILIFHGIEVLVMLLALSKFFPILFFVFMGFLVHLIEDSLVSVKFKYLERKLFLTYAIYLHHKNKVK